MHVKTDKRLDQVRELRPFVLESLPYREIDRTKYRNSRDMIIRNEVYDEYDNPIGIMADRIFNSMCSYSNAICTSALSSKVNVSTTSRYGYVSYGWSTAKTCSRYNGCRPCYSYNTNWNKKGLDFSRPLVS